ncbi:MAG: zinc-dependent metalloprotease [Pseudonocardia sp.]|nr:zinc-dependent metalloprotease [Pseudonocardia sp.]
MDIDATSPAVATRSGVVPAGGAGPLESGLPVNWSLAKGTSARLMAPGPQTDPSVAAELVARLRTDSATAEGHVRETTGLGAGLPLLPADVLDRPAWANAALDGMKALTANATLPQTPKLARAVTGTTAGAQVGALLAYLGARVLGQYDPFGGPDGAGRLILVAPNIYAAQQSLGVESEDFALWVCLHEATHRLQFTAVPWLRDYFSEQVGALLSIREPDAAKLSQLPAAIRSMRGTGGDPLALVELLQGPEQKAVLDRLLALTTLLEGHADHVMDAVGPRVVPSVDVIRERFAARRRGGGIIDRLLRTLLGVEAKMRQYAVGAAFVRQVEAEIGMSGLNRVWESPETLPTRAELDAPQEWLRRVA